jgi:hypothetical protein
MQTALTKNHGNGRQDHVEHDGKGTSPSDREFHILWLVYNYYIEYFCSQYSLDGLVVDQ